MKKSRHKWLHHDIQNETLQDIAFKIMFQNVREMKNAEYFSILMDETVDIVRTEQVSIFYQVVSSDLIASEYFMEFYSTASTKSKTLIDIAKDVHVRFDLPLSKLRGQCYDGAANVSGTISGLQQRIKEEEPRALFVYCNAHNLNRVIEDGIEKVLVVRKFIREVRDMINCVPYHKSVPKFIDK
ncbi:zinc finger MYM-type protein 1-like [Belonocnema kinseyi]|uniref:zinc finger MYM-type protein 1-like n=1 Tax=Belonocnema kinseyi TaxID=2817044 RepID=UPI00143DDADC|nr:zinc finger MYM-type protein 1-like [Belonocnema kinseyi]